MYHIKVNCEIKLRYVETQFLYSTLLSNTTTDILWVTLETDNMQST